MVKKDLILEFLILFLFIFFVFNSFWSVVFGKWNWIKKEIIKNKIVNEMIVMINGIIGK